MVAMGAPPPVPAPIGIRRFDVIPEAKLSKSVNGVVPDGEGWFVLNARDALG